MRAIELLAPAKDLECGIAAIDSGADAVYIGGPSFGARVNAPNSLEDIKKLCDYAHNFKAKIHVTINTILSDQELAQARDLAFKLYDTGVDALIIQDLGLLNGPLPPLELHASTQQNNAVPGKVKFLEDAGFSQVVLARELSINEIKQIRAQTKVKLEAFIHGALCVGISGRCYLSAAITGRSANRGECAQLCRVAQTLIDEHGNVLARDKYLLSMKDLNQSSNIEELIDAGISSFKIEGRLKDVNYVRNVTAYYRNKIDEIISTRADLKRSSCGHSVYSFTPDVSKSFNRGFTEYNTHEIKDNYANFDAPGFVGTRIGKLIKQQNHDLTFKLSDGLTLHNGDSLNYFRKDGSLEGFRISTVKDNNTAEIFQSLPRIEKNTAFYRSKDAAFEKLLNGDSSKRTLKLRLTYTEKADQILLKGEDETGSCTEVAATLPEVQKANDVEKLKQNIQAKLGRLGGSIYELENIEIALSYEHFVPQSLLNQLRRELIEKLFEIKTKARQNVPHDHMKLPQLCNEERNLGFEANLYNLSSKDFYRTHGAVNVVDAYESQPHHDAQTVLTSKHCLRYCFDMCPLRHKRKAPDLYLLIGGKKFELKFDCKKCYMKLIGPLDE